MIRSSSFILSAPLQAADKIRISMTGFAGQFMTFPLAQKRGFLKEEGIEAEIVRISAAAGRAALTNGDIDYSTGIGGTAINGALSGIPIRVVACFVPAPVLGLVARPEFKTVQALKGKTIAILDPWRCRAFCRAGDGQAWRSRCGKGNEISRRRAA